MEAFRRSLACTRTELEDALLYVAYGEEDEAEIDVQGKGRDADAPRPSTADWLWSDLAEAVGVTGAGLADLNAMTVPTLRYALRKAYEAARREFRDTEASRASVAWYALIDEIAAKAKGGAQ